MQKTLKTIQMQLLMKKKFTQHYSQVLLYGIILKVIEEP